MRTRRGTALRGVSLHLGYHGHPVVHGAAVGLCAGRVTALVGPNGSGKSTLLRALARLHAPAGGALRISADGGPGGAGGPSGGDDRAAHPGPGPDLDALALTNRAFARRVTLLAQSRPTPTGLSVRDVVTFGRHPHRGRWRGEDPGGPAAVERALRVTRTAELADRAVDELSGGQLQRVWLACCLAQDTGVLLLDEPTTFLDLRYQVEILDLVRDLADDEGVAVGVVLHDLDQAAAVADEIVLLAEGRVRACGTPAEVLTPALLTEAYGIAVEVDHDPRSGLLRTRPVGRHPARGRTAHTAGPRAHHTPTPAGGTR